MPSPTSKEELETVLGMATYLGEFAPNLSDVTAPLRDLTKKENAFIWDAVSENAYNNTKQLLCKEPGSVLAYFDPQKDVVQKGLGAALLQGQHPISYASRCMMSAEQNYAQIEKELLAVVFACERFHQYTYGRDITFQSDHKPLEAITNKPLACAPRRLQRMLLRLQRYNVKVVYVPGKQIPWADTLSRIFVKIEPKLPRHHLEDSVRVHETLTTSDLSEEVGVFEILHTAVTDARIEKVRAAMKHDQSMQILIRTIQSGSPNERRRCPKQIQDFWNIREELAIVDDESSPLVIKGHRIEQREEILQQLHIGHFGIEKTKQRARDAVYWPRLNTDIESLITRCSICQEHQWAPQKEPMVNRPIPTRPFQMVAVDLFECDGKHYLSLQDYYSRYIEVERLYSTRASFMKGIMARHGIPEQVFSDNGPQFSCAEFAKFANTWGFVHSTSSPRYPQSNGLAEKAVQTAKRIVMKATASGRDPYIALLEYRTTPISDCGKSPAPLLMSRRLRSILPSTPASLQPDLVNPEDIQLRFEEKQDKQKTVYDRNARTRASISVGDQILMRKNSGGYQSAVVTRKTDAPRSYNVRTKDGAIYRPVETETLCW